MKPMILLYHIDDLERKKIIEETLRAIGCDVKFVELQDYSDPIGYIIGLEEILPLEKTQEETIDEEMMIIAGVNHDGIGNLLSTLKQQGITIKYKAVLTPTNQHWDAVSLFTELKREHEEIKKQRMLATQKLNVQQENM